MRRAPATCWAAHPCACQPPHPRRPATPAAGKGRRAIASALRLCAESELESAGDVAALRDWAASAWDYLAMGEWCGVGGVGVWVSEGGKVMCRAAGLCVGARFAERSHHTTPQQLPAAGWRRVRPAAAAQVFLGAAAHRCCRACHCAGNYPYPSSYIVNGAQPPLPAYPVRAACAHLADERLAEGDPVALLQALGAAVGVFYK